MERMSRAASSAASLIARCAVVVAGLSAALVAGGFVFTEQGFCATPGDALAVLQASQDSEPTAQESSTEAPVDPAAQDAPATDGASDSATQSNSATSALAVLQARQNGSAGTSSDPAAQDTTASGLFGSSTPASQGFSDSGSFSTGSSSAYAYEAVVYDKNWTFTIKVPKGWEVTEVGYGPEACVEAYDPQNPAIRMIFYGNQSLPGTKLTADLLGYSFVLDPATMENYISLWPEIGEAVLENDGPGMPQYLRVSSVSNVESQPETLYSSQFTDLASSLQVADEAIVTADMVCSDDEGTHVKALFHGLVLTADMGSGMTLQRVMFLSGVIAPEDEFVAVFNGLAQSGCLGSFSVTDEYTQAQLEATMAELSL